MDIHYLNLQPKPYIFWWSLASPAISPEARQLWPPPEYCLIGPAGVFAPLIFFQPHFSYRVHVL